jgi:hypothetical protein
MLLAAAALARPEPPDVDDPLRTTRQETADVALVIGNEAYYAVPRVAYARRDAAAVAGWLSYTRGIPPERVRVLDDVASEQISAAVAELAPLVGEGGTFWLYYAGHGAADPSTGERLLLGVDVQPDPAVFAARSVALADLQEAAGAGGHPVVSWIDACFNGAGRGGELVGEEKRFAVPAYAVPVASVSEWAATGPEQLAGPWHAVEHGAFTWLAVGASRGWADGELDGARDGTVTLGEAQAYVARTLRDVGVVDQVPLLTGDGATVLAVGDALEPAPPPELLATLPGVPPRRVRRVRTGSLVGGALLVAGAASLAGGFSLRGDLRDDLSTGSTTAQDALGRASAVNALLGAGWTSATLGVSTMGFAVVVGDAPGVGWRARW